MNPNDEDSYYNDDQSDLFPNAGKRVSSHNFYGDQVTPKPPQPHYQQLTENEINEYCPRCDARLEIRESTLGKYIACTRFPDCRYTQPYDEPYNHTEPAPEKKEYYEDGENEKDYLQEAANEMSGYEKTDEQDSPHQYTEQGHTPTFDREEPTNSYHDESIDVEEGPSAYSASESQDLDQIPRENELSHASTQSFGAAKEEKVGEPKQTKPSVSFHDKANSLRLHPGFLKKEEVNNSSRWAELKQKRLRDQAVAALSPEQAASDVHIPSQEELAETLKKLEEDVQKLQQSDGLITSSSNDQNRDDVLPSSLRQALREKTNNDNDY